MHPLHAPVSALIESVSRDIVLPHYQRLTTSQIFEKSPGDLVTVADRESELALESGLRAILPSADVVGEEATAADATRLDALGGPAVWVIDPIDGTGNYARGDGPFGIMVALLAHGRTVAGWIYDPRTGRMCHAVADGGAFIDGTVVQCGGLVPEHVIVSAPPNDPFARVATARGWMVEAPPFCAAEQYARLVLGQQHVTAYKRALPWDHAAGALLLHEAGGKVAHHDGAPYRPGDGRPTLLAASTAALWDEAMSLMTAGAAA